MPIMAPSHKDAFLAGCGINIKQWNAQKTFCVKRPKWVNAVMLDADREDEMIMFHGTRCTR